MGTEVPRRIVVAGTGTGVGKTWLSCALLRRLRDQGRTAIGLKPIESGVVAEADTDARLLARASALSLVIAPAPYQLRDPISPHLAARREGTTINLDEVLTYVRHQESSVASQVPVVTLIESAGGLFSPLALGVTNFDLARILAPAAWLLVAPDSLGVLHDLTSTLRAADAFGRKPDAIALSRARPPDASTGTNADEIERLGIATRPWVFPDDGAAGLDALLATLIGLNRA